MVDYGRGDDQSALRWRENQAQSPYRVKGDMKRSQLTEDHEVPIAVVIEGPSATI